MGLRLEEGEFEGSVWPGGTSYNRFGGDVSVVVYSDLLKMPTKTKSGNVAVASLPEGLQVGEYKSLSPDVKRVGQNPISKTFMGMTA